MVRRDCLLTAISVILAAHGVLAQSGSGEEFKRKTLAKWDSLNERIRTVRGERAIEYFQSSEGKPLSVTRCIGSA